jgi:APA family basic amino acid/polyamine antiporter
MKRPFRVPFNLRIKGRDIPLTAVIGAVASFAVWLLIIITKPEGRYLGFGWLIFGVVMYLIYRRKKRISPTEQVVLEKIKISHFHSLEVKKILLPLRSTTQTETVQVACSWAKMHKAKLTALHVIEVPFSLPLETALPHRVGMAGMVLKTAEAIALDQGVNIDLHIVRARKIPDAIVELATTGRFDLIILESIPAAHQLGLGDINEEILQKALCRIWICRTEEGESLQQVSLNLSH